MANSKKQYTHNRPVVKSWDDPMTGNPCASVTMECMRADSVVSTQFLQRVFNRAQQQKMLEAAETASEDTSFDLLATGVDKLVLPNLIPLYAGGANIAEVTTKMKEHFGAHLSWVNNAQNLLCIPSHLLFAKGLKIGRVKYIGGKRPVVMPIATEEEETEEKKKFRLFRGKILLLSIHLINGEIQILISVKPNQPNLKAFAKPAAPKKQIQQTETQSESTVEESVVEVESESVETQVGTVAI